MRVKDSALHVLHEGRAGHARGGVAPARGGARAAARLVCRAMSPSAQPEDLVGTAVPDLRLPTTAGGTFGLRDLVGRSPLALFFVIRSGTPG